MRKTTLAVLLAALAALVPSAGHAAQGVAAGVCGISGRADYTPAVTTLPTAHTFLVDGTLTCVENVQASTGGIGLKGLIGFFHAEGAGQIGCVASQGGGTFTMGIATSIEANTRDLWTGTFSNAGLAVQVLTAQITGVKHQTRPASPPNNNLWTDSGTETVVASVATGQFTFGVELDDVTTCGGPGISNRSFLGNLVYSYVTS